MNFVIFSVTLLVGVMIGIAILAMLQMGRHLDDETEVTRGQVPPKRPPPPPAPLKPNSSMLAHGRSSFMSRDTIRINWLEQNSAGVTVAAVRPTLFAVILDREVVGEIRDDLRSAIDSAIHATQPESPSPIASETT